MAATGKKPVQFRNLVEREKKAKQDLESLQSGYLHTKEVRGSLTDEEQADLDRIDAVLTALEKPSANLYGDPLFAGVKSLFQSAALGGISDITHDNGAIVVLRPAQLQAQNGKNEATDNWAATIRVALVLGFIELDRIALPRVAVQTIFEQPFIVPVKADAAYHSLTQAFFSGNGEAEGCKDVASRVLRILADEGDADKHDLFSGVVSTVEFARVMRGLVAKGIDVDYPQLGRAVNAELNKIQAVGDDAPLHETTICVPDFETPLQRTQKFQPDNIRLMGSMISTFMLDQLKLWDVMEIVQRDFRQGTLLVRRSAAATKIYQWWRDAATRMSEIERRETLALTLGVPGGSPETRKNTDFDRLWTQFIVSFTSLVRQNTVDNLLRSPLPGAIGQQRVRKAARDLCVNLSVYGYGMAYYSALEFNKQVQTIIDVLQSDEVRANYGGATDWSQVVDEIATLELGGARNSYRYQNLATCGGIITAWLAKNVETINQPTGSLINLRELLNGAPQSSPNPTKDPSDYDCWNACEMWMTDQQISVSDGETLAQKSLPSPQSASRPIQVPAFAREALEQAGVTMGVRPGNGYSNGFARF
jgi:hypothetical protein